jgi:hypothetical protein
MTFEDDLRTTLQSQADDLHLRGRGATEVMHLARRRQHRARRAGVVAAAGVLGIGAVGIVSARARMDDGVSATSWAADTGLADTGPLELDWKTTPGGISGGATGEPILTEDAAGAIYALSTAPGSAYDPDTGAGPEAALYRLGDDGTWIATSTAAASTPLGDLTADDTVLYALGTSPGSGSLYDTVVSSSTDGGATWNRVAATPVDPPSSAVAWEASSTLSIERVPGATAAVVSTTFSPSRAVVDRALAEVGLEQGLESPYGWEFGADGLMIVDYSSGRGDAEKARAEGAADAPEPANATPPTTAAPVYLPAPPGSDPVGPDGIPDSKVPTVVATVAWASFGIGGPADLAPRTQVLIEQAGAWVPVDSPALAGISVSRFTSAGQDLILEGWAIADPASGAGSTRTFASGDGRTWRPITTMTDQSRLFGVGAAWVDLPWSAGDGQPTTIRSSGDSGASWQTLDLATVDPRLGGSSIASASTGPLGLAFLATDYRDSDDPETYLVTSRDLINFTVTSLSDIIGRSAMWGTVDVGSDRVVVSAGSGADGDGQPIASVTAIGTPVR